MKDKDLKSQLQDALHQMFHYRIVIFLAVIALVYGFVAWRVNTLVHVEPTSGQVASELHATSPKIDQATVDKIKQLQDNSVNVQALFDQARQNPFHE